MGRPRPSKCCWGASILSDTCPAVEDGEHEWEYQDDSFDHEYGTEVVRYWLCLHCMETKELGPGDCDE